MFTTSNAIHSELETRINSNFSSDTVIASYLMSENDRLGERPCGYAVIGSKEEALAHFGRSISTWPGKAAELAGASKPVDIETPAPAPLVCGVKSSSIRTNVANAYRTRCRASV